ncbi:endonuclease/exonuclease/phosphatase family protein [bacterium]|nr:endonuclease/exonuclease/phosphatase family protein [bacterium]
MPAPSDRVVTVATYNVHSCVGTDGRRDPERVAQAIGELDADIVGLQEVDSGYRHAGGVDQLDALSRRTKMHAVAGPTLVDSAKSYGNGLLSRRPPLGVRRLDLSVPGFEPRGALVADFDVDGLALRVIVTHFGLSAAERFTQAGRLVGLLDDRPEGVQILLGDFNEWAPRRRTIRLLATHFGPSARLRTFPSRFPLFALDRIWVVPPGQTASARTLKTPLFRIASDHLPVVARIRLGS